MQFNNAELVQNLSPYFIKRGESIDILAIDKQVIAGDGLTGGGYLTSDVTLNVGAGDGIDVQADTVGLLIKASGGLDSDVSGIFIDLQTPSALVIDATGIAVADSLAGDGLTMTSKVMAVGASTVSIATTNTPTADSHAHAVTASSSPGQAASLLATDSSGFLEIYRLAVGSVPPSPLVTALTVSHNAWPQLEIRQSAAGAEYFRISVETAANSQSTIQNYGDLDISVSGAVDFTAGGFRITTSSNINIIPSNTITITGTSILMNSSGDVTIAPTGGNDVNLSPTGTIFVDPGGNLIDPVTGYDVDLGQLTSKFRAIHAAELWVETLVAHDTIATIGGRILVGPTTILESNINTGVTTISVEHNQMASGDIAYMEADGKVEFISIDSGPSGGGPYTYTVTRDLDGTGGNLWYAGDAVFNTGTTGDGFIDLYSVQGISSGGIGPTIAGMVRLSTVYNDWAEHWAIGNLQGIYGQGSVTYGVGLGRYGTGYDHILISDAGGIEFWDGDEATGAITGSWDGTTIRIGNQTQEWIQIDPGGGITFKNSGTVNAQMSSTTWILGNSASENVYIIPTQVAIRDGSTVYTSLEAGVLTLGNTSDDYIDISAANGIRFYDDTAALVGQLTASLWTIGSTSSENVQISSSGILLRDATTTVASVVNSVLTLGVTTQEYLHVSSANGIRFFDDSAGLRAQLTGTDWTLGATSGEHVNITTAGVYIKNSTTTYTALEAGTLTLGDTSQEYMLLTAAEGIRFYDNVGTNVAQLSGSSWWIGEQTSDHVFIASTGIQIRDSLIVRGHWQTDGDIFIGSNIANPRSTYFSVFAVGQTYNTETMAPGDLLIGDNSGSVELVTDGGLENWDDANTLTSWANTGTGALNRESTKVRSGTYSAKLTYSSGQASFAQTISTSFSTTYTLQGYGRSEGAQQCRYSVYDVTNTSFLVAESTFGNAAADVWERFEFNFTTASNTASIIIEFLSGNSAGVVYFDDISMVEGPYLNFLFDRDGGTVDIRRGQTNVFSFDRDGTMLYGQHLLSTGIVEIAETGVTIDTNIDLNDNPSLVFKNSNFPVNQFRIDTYYETNGTTTSNVTLQHLQDWTPVGASIELGYESVYDHSITLEADNFFFNGVSPLTPGGKWSRSSDVSINTGTWYDVVWQTETRDTDSMWTSGADININTTGLYIIIGGIQWDTHATNSRITAVEKNGTTELARTRAAGVSGTSMTVQVACIEYLTDTDYIRILGHQNSGTSIYILNAYVWIYRLL
jgi:hypothetical protein